MFNITIHGGGYVGLTAAVHFAKAGQPVKIYDPDPTVVQAINDGSPKAGEFLGYLGGVGGVWSQISATADFNDVLAHEVHLLAVPTERAGKPDDSIVLKTLDRLFSQRFPVTVIVESTLIPGTIDRFLATQSPSMRASLGDKCFLAVAPRRDWFADPDKNLSTLKRNVGGVTAACTARAVEILSAVSPDIDTADYRTVEITKSLENALLHVPLMMVHQLACALPNHDVARALEMACTHWRLMKLHLNFGSGGRCVPLGTQYLVRAVDNDKADGTLFDIGEEVVYFEHEIRQMCANAVDQHLPMGSKKILVMGIAYRPNFKDAGLSPGLDVARALAAKGHEVTVTDPMWYSDELTNLTGLPALSGALYDVINMYDAIVLATPHTGYLLDAPIAGALRVDHYRAGQLIMDAQGAWAAHREAFAAKGVKYVRVGDPGWRGL